MMIRIYKPPFLCPITAKDPAEDHAIVLSTSDTELDETGLGGIVDIEVVCWFYKCFRVCTDGEIHREHNCVFILIVSITRRLAPIFLKPVAHPYNRSRKILTG